MILTNDFKLIVYSVNQTISDLKIHIKKKKERETRKKKRRKFTSQPPTRPSTPTKRNGSMLTKGWAGFRDPHHIGAHKSHAPKLPLCGGGDLHPPLLCE
jgi:hypothetical protein